MKINDILQLESIKIGLVAKNKKDALKQMVDLANKSKKLKDTEQLKTQVLEREELASTAIGNSIALPHTKSFAVNSIVASFAILKTPLTDFISPDEKPIQIILLLLANENLVGKQLRYLTYFSKVLSEVENINKLLHLNKEDEILNFLDSITENI